MPRYEYRCPNGHDFEVVKPVSRHSPLEYCPTCESMAEQVLSAPLSITVACDVRYDSPIDGRPITSHAARIEDMKRHNCIPYDPEMKKDAERIKAERQQAFERGVEETVCHEIAKMDAPTKAQLKKEIVNMGAEAVVVR